MRQPSQDPSLFCLDFCQQYQLSGKVSSINHGANIPESDEDYSAATWEDFLVFTSAHELFVEGPGLLEK